jgi:hypothetical protein
MKHLGTAALALALGLTTSSLVVGLASIDANGR